MLSTFLLLFPNYIFKYKPIKSRKLQHYPCSVSMFVANLVTTFAFNKAHASWISNFHVAYLCSFHHISFCVVVKGWSHWQNLDFLIENQLAINTDQLMHNSLFNQMLTSINWSVNFSSVLGYARFKQPHDNKKLKFSIDLLH